MIQLDKFLLIFSLETGGQFLGWLGIITNGIILPVCVTLLIVVCADKDSQWLQEIVAELNETGRFPDPKTFWDLFIIALVLILVMTFLYLIVSILLVRGVRDVSKTIENALKIN